MINSYKDLIVWQKAIELVKESYKIAGKFPNYEIYGLGSQIRRASVSIPANVAEGQRRKNTKEFLQFLRIAYGSASELETELIIAQELYSTLDYLKAFQLIDEIHKMLTGLIYKLQDKK